MPRGKQVFSQRQQVVLASGGHSRGGANFISSLHLLCELDARRLIDFAFLL